MPRTALSHTLGLIGAAIGGVVGYYAYLWIIRQGFDALVLPGALLGTGCGLLARHESTPRGIACGLAGLVLGLFCDWRSLANPEPTFALFLARASQLQPFILIMIVVGALMAFWMGRGTIFGGPGLAGVAAERSGRMRIED